MIYPDELEQAKEDIRKNLLIYTRQALDSLPEMDEPDILDIGCGSGVPTIELSRLTAGHIIAIDIDDKALDIFRENVKALGINDRIEIIHCSMFDLDFPVASFDIIWGEGSIAFIGFENGLRTWRKFLRPGGFLVVHDDISESSTKMERIGPSGYELVNHFKLSREVWWRLYYEPLEKKVEGIFERTKSKLILSKLNREKKEIETAKNNPGRCESIYYIMKKVG